MTDLLPLRDALQDAQYAVTQAEELLDLTKGQLARAKKAYLDAVLADSPAPVAAGFTAPKLQCEACLRSLPGPHAYDAPNCHLLRGAQS